MNPDPLAGSRAKVERAKCHVQQLQVARRAFLESDPYKFGAEMNAEGRIKGPYRITSVTETPLPLSAIVGDILNNLRSALDHIAFRAVCVGLGYVPTNPREIRRIQYPIANSAKEYPSLRDGKIEGAKKAAFDAIDATKPYLGGNDVIWTINELNNIDKHRFLLTAGGAFKALNLRAVFETHARGLQFTNADGTPGMTGKDVTFADFWVGPRNGIFPLKVGTELPSLYIDPDKKMQFAFDIAFSEPKIVEGKPLIETLQHMVNVIDALLPGFVSALS